MAAGKTPIGSLAFPGFTPSEVPEGRHFVAHHETVGHTGRDSESPVGALHLGATDSHHSRGGLRYFVPFGTGL